MTKPSYTPGPWEVGEVRHEYDCVIRATGSRDPICTTVYAGYAKPTAQANARLICAAPDMAEALKTLLAETESLLRDIDRTTKATKQNADSKSMSAEYEAMFDAACNAARAALQKAGLL